MSQRTKAEKLLEVAGKTLDNGDREVAKSVAVMAMKQEDAVDALNKLLPSMPEPSFEIDEEDLSETQVAKIMSLARDLQKLKKHKIANQILAKVEKIESKKKRRKPTA